MIAIASGAIEPRDNSEHSQVTLALDFDARGIGRLLLPVLVRWTAKRALRQNVKMLKAALERGGRA